MNDLIQPLDHFWSRCVGAGRASEGLRAGWLEHLALARRELGVEYVRFHGLFHDDMFIHRRGAGGHPVYNFQYVDELFDRMREIGVKPFVEFGFSPRDLARETETVFWWRGHGAPPTDLGEWADLITATVTHWIERYGIEEVRSWYFEVWNEPNLDPFFRGTRSEYFALYAVTAHALKEIDGALRVGGPATSNFVPDSRFRGETEDFTEHALVREADEQGRLDDLDWRPVWVEELLAYCAEHAVPLDFVSAHPYPTDWPLDEHGAGLRLTRGRDATIVDTHTLREIVRASAYPDAEIHLTEWSTSSSPRDFAHDWVPAAVFVVHSVLGSIGQADSLAYWTFTDVFEENGAGDAAFHGGFGLINYQGIPKPAFTAYRFLNRLGDTVVDRWADGILTSESGSGRMQALVYHYPDEVPIAVPASWGSAETAARTQSAGSSRSRALDIPASAGETFAVHVLAPGRADAVALWNEMGSPSSPTRAQSALLTERALATVRDVVTAGEDGLRLELVIEPWSIVLIEQLTSAR